MKRADKRLNFTQAAIKAIPSPDKLTFYYDEQTRGLAIAVLPSGTKTFYLYKKVDGKPRQVKLGPFPDMTIAQARDKATELSAAILRNEDPAMAAGRKRGEQTFGDLFAWWMDGYAKLRRKSWREDQDVFRRSLAPLANLVLSKVTKAELRRLHAKLGETSGRRTANKAIELARAVFNRAIAHDLYEGSNPAMAVEMFETPSRERRLMPDELPAFFQALDEEANPDIRDYVLMSLFTGQRQANVLSMRWADVDWTMRVWRIQETKNGRPILVALDAEELALLERRKAEHGASPWVFPGRTGSKHGHLIEPKSGWARVLKRTNAIRAEAGMAPMNDLRLHDLRRTLGSFMGDTGASLPMIGKALGHSSQAATAIYARLSVDPVREAKRRAVEQMLTGATVETPVGRGPKK